MSRPAAPTLAAVVVAAMLLTGCLGGDTVPEPAATVDRIDVVRGLRDALAGPAVALGRAAAEASAAVRALRIEPHEDPADRLTAVAVARGETLSALADELAATREVEIAGDGPDARAARSSWDEVLAAAEAVHAAALEELTVVVRLAEVDRELGELTEVWQEPGSRREQLAALDAAAERADALAAELGAMADVACDGDVQRRVEAATFVAGATRELRRYVAGHQGNTFDQRRAELSQDPYGLGAPLTVSQDPGCWDERGPTGTASSRLDAGLDALEQALNPADLATPQGG